MQVPPFSLSKQISELGSDLDQVVLDVIRSGQYIGGHQVRDFESNFAKSIGVPFAVSCNSGTDALILALRALDVGPGDEVITSSFTFFATAEAISSVGAKPVFVDVDPLSYLIDLQKVQKAINSSTKVILPVHLFGRPVNMTELINIARKNDIKVVEDCAQASGSSWENKQVGSFGDIGCFSFFPTKNLGAAGDAGAITTSDEILAKRIRQLAVHGMPERYKHSELGYNSRLDALQAGILNIKLPNLSQWIDKRIAIANRYHNHLNGLPGITLPPDSDNERYQHSWNQYVIKVCDFPIHILEEMRKNIEINGSVELLDDGINARDLIKRLLHSKGVDTIIYYPIPIHLQPAYKFMGYSVGDLPFTEMLCNQVLSLPIFPELTVEQQDHVILSIREIVGILKKA